MKTTHILYTVLLLWMTSCGKSSPGDPNDPNNPPAGAGITETITTFNLNDNSVKSQINWIGQSGIYLYGHTAHRIFKINTETKEVEKVFDLSFDFVLSTGSLIFKLAEDGYLYFSGQCGYADPEISVGKISVDGEVAWIKRVKVTLGANHYSYHLDPQAIQVFDNAVWVAGSRTIVRLHAGTGALEAARRLPFEASSYAVPTAVVPVSDGRIAISFRNAINHLTLLYCKRSDLSFTEMVSNKMTMSIGGLTTWSVTGNIIPVGGDKLLYLSKFTQAGTVFFPVSYAALFDLKGNALKSKILHRNALDQVDISAAHRGADGKYYAMLRHTFDIDGNKKKDMVYVVSADNALNLTRSKGILWTAVETKAFATTFSAPFAYKGNNIVTSNGNNQLYWIDHTRLGCIQDNYMLHNEETMDLPFGMPGSSTTFTSYAGITFATDVVSGNATVTARIITKQVKEDCVFKN